MLFLLTQVWPGLIAAFALGAALGLVLRRALAGLAFKKDIPDMSYYMLRAEVTAPSDLTGFARWTDLPDVSQFVTADVLTQYVQRGELPDMSSYARMADLEGFVSASALEPLARKADIVGPDLRRYALKSDLPDVSRLARKSDLPAAPDLRDYVRRDELPSAPDLSHLVTRAELGSLQDRNKAATPEEVAALVDLTPYVRRSELPDVSGLLSAKEVRVLLQDKDRDIAELRSLLAAERAARAGDVARLETRMGLQGSLITLVPKSRLRRGETAKPAREA